MFGWDHEAKIMIGGQAKRGERLKEHLAVLPCGEQDRLNRRLPPQLAINRRHLNSLGTSPNNKANFHL